MASSCQIVLLVYAFNIFPPSVVCTSTCVGSKTLGTSRVSVDKTQLQNDCDSTEWCFDVDQKNFRAIRSTSERCCLCFQQSSVSPLRFCQISLFQISQPPPRSVKTYLWCMFFQTEAFPAGVFSIRGFNSCHLKVYGNETIEVCAKAISLKSMCDHIVLSVGYVRLPFRVCACNTGLVFARCIAQSVCASACVLFLMFWRLR